MHYFAAVFRLVTQRSSLVFCVTSLKTAAKETIACGKPVPNLPEFTHVGSTGQNRLDCFAFVHAVKGQCMQYVGQ